ncbi:Glutamine amidotransferases class-II [Solimonas aquatica]|uniref:Glutamine amidotransferases class-II n=1 Tax=Solimonas aquatica TaxID=489703 RepID=A0A1H9LK89_9GAMM|nr:class II glutamine amidotransferase [Solimonas aquatica]SER11922.1 Glutamine amidotransferases class-II [Solimonas aquatica]
MCLIVHKPAGLSIPAGLLLAAAAHNNDGWGLMGFADDGALLLERHAEVDTQALLAAEQRWRRHEYVLHLRRQTRGGSGLDNVHPFKISEGLWLMHNGTVHLKPRVPGKSDTWHLVQDVLRPLVQRYPGLLSDPAFLPILEHGLRSENKLALLDLQQRRIVLVNRHHGAELDGLWLSNTRWIDARLFPLAQPPQRQEWQPDPAKLSFG